MNKLKKAITIITTLLMISMVIMTVGCGQSGQKCYPSGNPSEILDTETYNQLQKKYSSIKHFQTGTAIVSLEGKYGLIDEKGEEVLSCIYDSITTLKKNAYRIILSGEKQGIVDIDGKMVCECVYDGASVCSSEYLALKQNGKWGFVDKMGNIIIQFKYESLYSANDSVFVAQYDGLYGVAQYDGSIVIPFLYDELTYKLYKENPITVVCEKGKWGIYNSKNQLVLDCKYDRINPSPSRYIAISINPTSSYSTKRAGLVDSETGEIMIPLEYNDMNHYSEGLVSAENFNGKYGFLDSVGNVIIPFIYEDAGDFSEGVAAVFKQSGYANTLFGIQPTYKCGYIDRYGSEVIPFKFKSTFSASICEFHDGRAVQGISSDNIYATTYGYIDKNGDWVVYPQFDDAEEFKNGVACVEINGRYGWIDTNGKWIIPCEYDKYGGYFINDTVIEVKKNGTKYYYDTKGRKVSLNE